MSGIYAMRRANGDWFAFEGRGRLRVPLFYSSRDAMMASLRNSGMLLFRPVALNAAQLKDMVPAGGASYVDFCMVKDPLVSLRRGKPLGQDDLVLLMQQIPPRLDCLSKWKWPPGFWSYFASSK